MHMLQKLGLTIRKNRKVLGYSQEKLAEISNLHHNYIGMVERGEKNVSFTTLCKISDALGLKLSELIKQVENG